MIEQLIVFDYGIDQKLIKYSYQLTDRLKFFGHL